MAARKREGEIDVLHILFPHARAELLRIFFRKRAGENHVRGLARESGFALSTIQDELKRLNVIGLLSSRTDGFHCFFQANESHPLAPALRQLVRIGSSDRAFVGQRKRPRRRQSGRRRDPLQHSTFLTSLGIIRRQG